jgi:hypothetical protein
MKPDMFTRISATSPTCHTKSSAYWQSFNGVAKGTDLEARFPEATSRESGQPNMTPAGPEVQDPPTRRTPPAWWKPRRRGASDAARYPATDSVSEWADEILALDQLLNEGFLPKPLMKLAEEAGRPVEQGNGSRCGLLQDHLESKGRSADEARAVMERSPDSTDLRKPAQGPRLDH